MFNQITLLTFINGLSILYHVKINYKKLESMVLEENKSTVIRQFPVLSKQLNVSIAALSDTFIGKGVHLDHLLGDARLVLTHDQYQALIKKIQKFRVGATRRALTIRQKKSKDPIQRVALLNYIQCIADLNGESFPDLCRKMGFKPTEFKSIVLKQPQKEVINALRQLPFIFDEVTLKDFQAILAGDHAPQQALMHEINQKVHDRRTLKQYIETVVKLSNTNLRTISRALHERISLDLRQGSGNQLVRLFDQLADLFQIPRNHLQAALARANLQDARHSYLARMKFIIHYRSSPINFHEPAKSHHFDRERIAHGFREVRAKIRADRQHRHSKINVKDGIWLIISGWGFMFNFSVNQFIDDNFKHFDIKDPQPTEIRQGDNYNPVKNSADWLVILHKLHDQLKTIRYAFNLTDVQHGDYGSVVSVKGIGNLSQPKARDFRSGLAELGSGRYQFTGKFARTGIKAIPRDNDVTREFYVPMLLIQDVQYQHKTVANEVWFNYSKSFVKLGQLEPGDRIGFKARIHRYLTGRVNKYSVKVANYELNYPSSIKLIRRAHARTMMPMPSDQAALTGYAIENNHSAAYDFSFRNYQYARHCKARYAAWKTDLHQSKKSKKK